MTKSKGNFFRQWFSGVHQEVLCTDSVSEEIGSALIQRICPSLSIKAYFHSLSNLPDKARQGSYLHIAQYGNRLATKRRNLVDQKQFKYPQRIGFLPITLPPPPLHIRWQFFTTQVDITVGGGGDIEYPSARVFDALRHFHEITVIKSYEWITTNGLEKC
jgi:hypothetical protein